MLGNASEWHLLLTTRYQEPAKASTADLSTLEYQLGSALKRAAKSGQAGDSSNLYDIPKTNDPASYEDEFAYFKLTERNIFLENALQTYGLPELTIESRHKIAERLSIPEDALKSSEMIARRYLQIIEFDNYRSPLIGQRNRSLFTEGEPTYSTNILFIFLIITGPPFIIYLGLIFFGYLVIWIRQGFTSA